MRDCFICGALFSRRLAGMSSVFLIALAGSGCRARGYSRLPGRLDQVEKVRVSTGLPTHMAISADSRDLAIGGPNHVAMFTYRTFGDRPPVFRRLWRARLARVGALGRREVEKIAFCEHGRLVAVADDSGRVVVFDTRRGGVVRRIRCIKNGEISGLCGAGDHCLLAAGSGTWAKVIPGPHARVPRSGVQLWNIRTGRRLARIKQPKAAPAAVASFGRRCVLLANSFGGPSRAVLYDWRHVKTLSLRIFSGSLSALAVGCGGRMICVGGSSKDGLADVRIMSPKTGRITGRWNGAMHRQIVDIAVDCVEHYVAAITRGQILILDAHTLHLVAAKAVPRLFGVVTDDKGDLYTLDAGGTLRVWSVSALLRRPPAEPRTRRH